MSAETEEALAMATAKLAEILQKQLRGESIGQGVWRSIEPDSSDKLVAVLRLPQGFVALDVKVSIDTEWTEHLGTKLD